MSGRRTHDDLIVATSVSASANAAMSSAYDIAICLSCGVGV